MEQTVIRELGDGLLLRRGTPADTEALADFNARVHSDDGWDSPAEAVRVWTCDLMARPHPTVEVDDFLVVEDTASREGRKPGAIVSSSVLIGQAWSYAGIDFGVGRPELIGTHPEYRRRGLVRAQMETLHQWSAGRGQLVQVITGIPWYYRQLGYEMALSMHGSRRGALTDLPALKGGEPEPYEVRSPSLRFSRCSLAIAPLRNWSMPLPTAEAIWRGGCWSRRCFPSRPRPFGRYPDGWRSAKAAQVWSRMEQESESQWMEENDGS